MMARQIGCTQSLSPGKHFWRPGSRRVSSTDGLRTRSLESIRVGRHVLRSPTRSPPPRFLGLFSHTSGSSPCSSSSCWACWGVGISLTQIGGVPLVLDYLEDGIVGFVRFFGDQDGEVVGVADDQVAREATVELPASAG